MRPGTAVAGPMETLPPPVAAAELARFVADYGVRAAHWGLDGDGEPVAVLLDFGVIDPPGGG